MSAPARAFSKDTSSAPRFAPLLLGLFVASGCAALIYEVVWLQLLQFIIGSTAVSVGLLLGSFMGGMCLGSLALPRLISPKWHPLRVYATLELAIGLVGLAVLYALPTVSSLYVGQAGSGVFDIVLRGLLCAACLLPPTMLMGATLPAIARWIEATPRGLSWLGIFYGGNTLGAVAGCLLSGFYLLRVHDMPTATFVAVGLNLAVALISYALAATLPYQAPTPAASESISTTPAPAASNRSVYVTIALSGLCALGAEVVWTRLLALTLGATVYTFSIILAIFLAGLGLGSSGGAFLARISKRPRLLLGLCQLGLTFGIAWAAYMLARVLPYWAPNFSAKVSVWVGFRHDVLRCLCAIFPAAVLWGASFPLALAALSDRSRDAGRFTGAIYAANTLGAIIGAVLFSLVVIPGLGTQHSQQILIILAGISALIVWSQPTAVATLTRRILAVVVVGAAVMSVAPVPGVLIAYGRSLMDPLQPKDFVIFYGEGLNSSVAVSETDGVRNFHVSGKIEASNLPQDLRLQRMLGHLPALLHGQPRSVLIVGCGAGVTAGSFIVHPSVTRIVICELEPLIPKVVARYFAEENHHLLTDPRVEVVYDDARHYMLTTHEKFDIITSDPIHPWVKGAASLYTQEYFELVKKRLNPGGFVTQWVPLYQSSPAVVQSELATFFAVFPHGTVWSNDAKGEGYDTVALGQLAPLAVDVDELQLRLKRPDHTAVATSLAGAEFPTAVSLLATYAGQARHLTPWLRDAEINHDRSLRLQYLAGLEFNAGAGTAIHDAILRHRVYPADLFHATGDRELVLRAVLQPAEGAP